METSRVLEVLHDRGPLTEPRWLLGSGFLVRTGVVVTAAHNLGEPEADPTSRRTVVRSLQGDIVDAEVLARSDSVDVALLGVKDLPAEPVALGRIDRERWTFVRDVQTVGFPDYKYDEDAPVPRRRGAAHTSGEIGSVEDYASGDLTLKINFGLPDLPHDVIESPWQGLSGAGVIVGDHLLGIAVEHRLKEGAGSLRVVPFTRLLDAPEGDRFCAILEVDFTEIAMVGGAEAEAQTESVSARTSMPAYVMEENLPADVRGWTAREDDLAWLESVLSEADGASSNGPRVAALTGRGGVGKSALAVRAAYRVRDRFPDGRLYVDLRGADDQALDPAVVLDDFLRIMDVPGNAIPPSTPARAADYRKRLAGRRVLVVLDNAASSEQLEPLLPTSPTNGVIVTSRPLLAGLSEVPTRELEVLGLGAAVELLAKLAGQERISAEPEAAARVAQYCGYLPIALRTAGARLAAGKRKVTSVADELADERTRLKSLVTDELDVSASFTLSYRTLSDAEKLAFRRLGLLYSADFTRWRVAALLDTTLTAADALVWRLEEAQLVDYWRDDIAGQPRFRLHDLVRVFARERAEDEPPSERKLQRDALARAGEAFLSLAEAAADHLEPGQARTPRPPGLERWRVHDDELMAAIAEDPMNWFSAERASLGSAILRGRDAGLHELCWRLTECLVGFFDLHSHWDDWERTHEIALEAARQAGDEFGEAATLRHLGRLRRYEDRMEEAAALLGESRAIYERLGDASGEVATLIDIIRVEWFRGRWDEAMEAFTRAERLLASVDDPHAWGRLLNSIGLVYHDLGRWEDAHAAFEGALEVFQPAGDRRWTAASLWGIGLACRSLGRFDEGLQRLGDAIPILGEVGNRRWQAVTLRSIGDIHRDLGQWQAAETELRAGLDILEEVGDRYWQPVLMLSLADVHRARGRHDDAEACLATALRELENRGDSSGRTAVGLATRARLRFDQQRVEEAYDDLRAALEGFAKKSDPIEEGRALTTLGHLHAARGELDSAADAWQRALEHFERLGYWEAPRISGLLSRLQQDGIVLRPTALEVLEELERLGGRPVEELTPVEARAQPGLGIAVEGLLHRRGQQRPSRWLADVSTRVLRSGDNEVEGVVYRPAAPAPVPLVLFLHGGGWVLDDQPSYEPSVRRLAYDTPATVIYVRYRLAPENTFPAALDDVLAALAWAHEHAADVGADSRRIGIMGQSAGGNLSMAACLHARESGLPIPSSQVLVYPVCDHRFDTPSYGQYERAPGLSSSSMRWFWAQYIGADQDGSDPLASPLRAANLSGLPPTHVITAEVDPLRDEGRELARRLREAGVDVVDDRYDAVMHGFFALVDVLPEADAACDASVAHLRATLGARAVAG
jgi:acetyl esterase/lipase/tetratricopeptide (TPR) repeat protein